MKYSISAIIALIMVMNTMAFSQNMGDTLRVQAFNFNSESRDTVISFPDYENLSFEKILLKYSMRCKNGLVSNSSNTNLGCGEWDYSCNTYLVDSSTVESVASTILSHDITNFTGTTFKYKTNPVYNYIRGNQYEVVILGTNSETEANINSGSQNLSNVIDTRSKSGRSQYLYTADELTSSGLSAGAIRGISLNFGDITGEARYFKIRIKSTNKTTLSGEVDLDGFTEVYYYNPIFVPNQPNRFQFFQPFDWDGTSNLIVDLSFNNLDGSNATETIVEGGEVAATMGLQALSDQAIFITNGGYIECDDYTGVGGTTNRTVEAWIKTTNGSNGEICSWGTNTTGAKWVFRYVQGRLRVEVNGGGTESSKLVNDGQWHHVACVLNGSSLTGIRFYVDGVLDNNSTIGTTVINTNVTGNNAYKLRISRGVNDRYLDGIIDDVRVWDTNLPVSTINEWKNLKITEDHPNYGNLQLYYTFDESGTTIIDHSGHNRNAHLIGDEYRVIDNAGSTFIKSFNPVKQRPNLNFYQGDFNTQVTAREADRPVEKDLNHFVVSRTIIPSDPTKALDDVIETSTPVEYWTPDYTIYSEDTGDIIDQVTLTEDGEIEISELSYFKRYPFYNELVSFVTPYGIGLDLGKSGKSWIMDMSDYESILKGKKRMLITLGGERQEDMDLEFLFIVGTPPRKVLQYNQLWQGTNRIGSANINDIINNNKFAPVDINLHPDAKYFKLKSSITGHGSEGEFSQNGGIVYHKMLFSGIEIFNWTITRNCPFNPIYPQGGTWIYERQGWCPGMQTLVEEQDLTNYVDGESTINLDYTTSSPQNPSGDYRYHVAHQLVEYGEANFQQDAAVVEIIAPNNTAEYLRVGTICANPTIRIRNTGAQELTELTIKYWLNDSQNPQSFTWTGSLDFMDDEIVTISSPKEFWYDIQAENNIFHVNISNPNSGTDEYQFNNSMTSTLDVPSVFPYKMSVEFRTNNAPSQNSYQLFNSNGDVVGSNNLTSANTTYKDDYDLVDDCYKLIVYDNGGDGVQWWANPNQGTGYVRIKNESGSIVKTFEPDFGGGFEHSFTTDFEVSAEDLEYLTSLKVFPNPADQFFTLEGKELMDTKFKIIDITGNEINASITNQSDTSVSFDIDSFPSGIYFIMIQKGELITSRKLIKR